MKLLLIDKEGRTYEYIHYTAPPEFKVPILRDLVNLYPNATVEELTEIKPNYKTFKRVNWIEENQVMLYEEV